MINEKNFDNKGIKLESIAEEKRNNQSKLECIEFFMKLSKKI